MIFFILGRDRILMFKNKFGKKRLPDLQTIAFYNLENLFDTRDDPRTLDDDFTPGNRKDWNPKRYRKKLRKLAKTIARIGEMQRNPAALIGVAEVENRRVIQDLIGAKPLKAKGYEFVHYDSPDERGIDTALLYHPDLFKPEESETITVWVENESGVRDFTRDILYVRGTMKGEVFHIFVNHWPSRRSGDQETSYKRMAAAQTLSAFMQGIEQENDPANFVVMGDFNDGPGAESIRWLTSERGLYNPMKQLLSPYRGSANYKNTWSLFDQILLSGALMNFELDTHSFYKADIFDKHFLSQWKGKFKGTPFRTFAGRKYLGGYSDHFPVFVQLKYNK